MRFGNPGAPNPGLFRFSKRDIPFLSSPHSELLPVLHQGDSSLCGGSRFTDQGGDRTGVFRAWLLQPLICNTEGIGWLAAGHRSFSPQPLRPTISISYGDITQSVLQSLRPGDWMVSLDLQDAYLQVPVHPDSRRYLRFCIGPHTFQFRALCFGLSSAPQVFTPCHGPDLLHYASPRLPDPPLSGRLASPWFFSRGDCPGEGLLVISL